MTERLLLPELEAHIAALAKRSGPLKQPVHAFLAGGIAVNYYTGYRMSDDVDIQWSRRVAIPPDLQVFEVVNKDDPTDISVVSMDGAFGDYLGSFHPDWQADAPSIARYGDIVLHVITPLDLAVSKIARWQDRDREDIDALAAAGLIKAADVEKRGQEAIEYWVGDTTFIYHNLNDAVEMVKRHEADGCDLT